jgi:hypothetical protein
MAGSSAACDKMIGNNQKKEGEKRKKGELL